MNPFIVRHGRRLYLYYAGGDNEGRRRICLATAQVNQLDLWHRLGPLFELGLPGSFDSYWCVLPYVVQWSKDRWHLYYTGNNGEGGGLGSFAGIGLATSENGRLWKKFEGNPVLKPTSRAGDPDAIGIGSGSVLKVQLANGSTEWRMYYIGCPTRGDDLFLNQQKRICMAVSEDGIRWQRRGAVLLRDPSRDYENIAVATPLVQQVHGYYRMWFSAIGTRCGAYSICYAESDDGFHWRRGSHYGDDLQLAPSGLGWESQMVEYPAVISEGNRLRLFYCGNNYGSTGIGTAVSSPLKATATKGPCRVYIVSHAAQASWDFRIPEALSCNEGVFKVHFHPIVDWQGPDSSHSSLRGTIWHEWQSNEADFQIICAYKEAERFGLKFIQGIHYRVLITPSIKGLNLRFTATNTSDQIFHNLVLFPCLGHPSPNFYDLNLEHTFITTEEGLTSLRDTDRGSGDPIRTHYRVLGKPPMHFYAKPFWGEPSRNVATSGAILRSRIDRKFTIGTSWENACEIFQNEDENHRCIHSVPTLGDLGPGETKTVCGEIVIAEGGPEKALDQIKYT